MYKPTDFDQQQISFFHFNSSCGMALDEKNEWIKNGNRLPWKAWEAVYAAMFPGIKGQVAKSCRMSAMFGEFEKIDSEVIRDSLSKILARKNHHNLRGWIWFGLFIC